MIDIFTNIILIIFMIAVFVIIAALLIAYHKDDVWERNLRKEINRDLEEYRKNHE